MAANPYTAQLKSFTSNTGNARRGLIDLYKLRTKGVESHYNYVNKLYGGAYNTTNKSYGASASTLSGFEAQGMKGVEAGGYDMGNADVRQAVVGIVKGGVQPYRDYLRAEGKAQGAWYKGYKGGEQYEDRTLKTGLKRERSAALSELEQGIIDVSTNLQGQAGAFTQQQNFLAQQQSYMNQMLQLQGQQATQAQGGGGGESAAEKWIISKESSGNVYADNPKSTAFGLGQLLISNRQAYGRQLGFNPNTTNYNEQLAMMRAYIKDRYGSAEAAMRFWQANGWY